MLSLCLQIVASGNRFGYRVLSHDVRTAMFVTQNSETGVMLVSKLTACGS